MTRFEPFYLLLFLLVLVSLLALPFLIIYYASWRYKREIAKAKTDLAVHYRALVEIKREEIIHRTTKVTNIIYVLIFIAAIVFFIVTSVKEGFEWEGILVLFIVVYDFYAYKHNYQLLIEKMRGNVSHMMADELISMNTPFALYLRGFNDDSYANRYKDKEFNELEFSRVVKEHLGFNMYAIGMTKELDSPRGAERVYVDDESWKETVVNLIGLSSRVYILVNDRDSCLWEMRQVSPYLEKTVFIVNDRRIYQQVREELAPYISFPEVGELRAKRFFFNHKMIPIPFRNGKRDYISIALLPDEMVKWEERVKKEEKELASLEGRKNARFEKGLYFVLMILAIFLFLYMISH